MRALLLLTCASCVTVTAEKSADLFIDVKAPHRVTATVDGKVRYEQTGPMGLVLKAPPGTKLCAGSDGVLGVCHAEP